MLVALELYVKKALTAAFGLFGMVQHGFTVLVPNGVMLHFASVQHAMESSVDYSLIANLCNTKQSKIRPEVWLY